MIKRPIYFDNAATTQMDERVFEAMVPFMKEAYGNPSGKYSLGYAARKAVNAAREMTAALINAEPDEIYFTSSGTEGNNMIIKSVLDMPCENGIRTVISTSVEHKSVLGPLKFLEKNGVRILYVPTDKFGLVSPKTLEGLLSGDAPKVKDGVKGLVSVMYVNNEVGTEQPIRELAEIAHKNGFLMHTDAVQAAGHVKMDVKGLGVDFLTVSGHKLYGPKGSGFVFVKRGNRIRPFIDGGGQERGLRSGTENVPGIVGLGKACEIALLEQDENIRKEKDVGIFIRSRLVEMVPDMVVNGNSDRILNLSFKGVNGTSLALRLDMEGICVSTGSACNMGTDERSHVLMAMGLGPEEADSSIRISIGRNNTLEEARLLVEKVSGLVSELRELRAL